MVTFNPLARDDANSFEPLFLTSSSHPKNPPRRRPIVRPSAPRSSARFDSNEGLVVLHALVSLSPRGDHHPSTESKPPLVHKVTVYPDFPLAMQKQRGISPSCGIGGIGVPWYTGRVATGSHAPARVGPDPNVDEGILRSSKIRLKRAHMSRGRRA